MEKIKELYWFLRYDLGLAITVSRWDSFGRWFKAEVFQERDYISMCVDLPFFGITIKVGTLSYQEGRLAFSRVYPGE